MNEVADTHSCPNCGEEVPGRFCAACGQEQRELLPSLPALGRELLSESLALDGKLPITLRALFWPPAELTVQWHAGRRVAYVSPIRLYLAAGFIFFLCWPLTAWSDQLLSFTHGFTAGWHETTGEAALRAASPATQLLVQLLPGLLILLLVPLFAAVVHILRGRVQPFVSSLVIGLHAHVLLFCLSAVLVPIRAAVGPALDTVAAPITLAALLTYMTCLFVRLDRASRPAALGRATAVVMTYFVVGVGVLGVSLAILISMAVS